MVIMGKCLSWLSAVALLLIMSVCMSGCMEEPVKNITPPPGPALVVDYYRTGGIAGADEHLVIFENGAVVYSGQSGRGAYFINGSSLAGLKDLFRSTNFAGMNESYPAPTPGADYYHYAITYRNHTVQAEDTGVPPLLQPIIQRLNEIISEKGPLTPNS
ncbi:MAG TPA: hypothetical protein VMS89_02420 [Methanoregulaceae archaeon]|nr:hypothetical protein [Methanoregulaceae archaeon]